MRRGGFIALPQSKAAASNLALQPIHYVQG